MKPGAQAIYEGVVVHRRVRPLRHTLRYKVFSVLFDCSDLESTDRRLRLFSYNRFNLFSLYDSDHGDGSPIEQYLSALASKAGVAQRVRRFVMLCYPRILGYAFNPLTVYFGLDEADKVCLTVYEVNNTFGQRRSYVVPANPDVDGMIFQRCDKGMYVSPFNAVEGEYAFHVSPLGEHLTVGVDLHNNQGPVMLAFFRGKRLLLEDRNLVAVLARSGLMTLKVIAGIHWEALKLWVKGLRLKPRPAAPARAVDIVRSR